MPNYGDPQYWEQRYSQQQGSTFDWLQDWESLGPIIQDLVSKDAKVLILGCGNAQFSEQMYMAGFHNIHNIDISEVVIRQMAERNLDKPDMTWQVMDVRNLQYNTDQFDLAVDKSTIDALLCGEDAYLNVARMTREVQRVIRPEGYYMAISYGAPESRTEHFVQKHLCWDLVQQVVNEGTNNPHYVYLCKKREGADKVCEENWDQVEALLREEEDTDIMDQQQYMGCSCSRSQDTPVIGPVNKARQSIVQKESEVDQALFSRSPMIRSRRGSDIVQTAKLKEEELDNLEVPGRKTVPIHSKSAQPSINVFENGSMEHLKVDPRLRLDIPQKPSTLQRRAPLDQEKMFKSQKSVSLKFELTGQSEIDLILQQTSFSLFTLESAYNSLHRAIFNFKQVTLTPNLNLSNSIVAMMVYVSVGCNGNMNQVNLVILDQHPYFKFEERNLGEKFAQILKSWNKLLSVTKQIAKLYTDLELQIRNCGKKVPELENLVKKSKGNTRVALEKDIKILNNTPKFKEDIKKSIKSFAKQVHIAKSKLRNPEFFRKIGEAGKEVQQFDNPNWEFISNLYWKDLIEF